MKTYSKQINDSEYSLKVVKILKDDSINSAIYSILGQVKNYLQVQSHRISSSFAFLDKKLTDSTKEKVAISTTLKETKR